MPVGKRTQSVTTLGPVTIKGSTQHVVVTTDNSGDFNDVVLQLQSADGANFPITVSCFPTAGNAGVEIRAASGEKIFVTGQDQAVTRGSKARWNIGSTIVLTPVKIAGVLGWSVLWSASQWPIVTV